MSKQEPIPIYEVLDTPAELRDQFPLTEQALSMIKRSRGEVSDIINGHDDRLIVVVGPCSLDSSLQVDGTPSVIEYSRRLGELAASPEIEDSLKIVMRCNPSKPRTGLGWTGLSQTDPVRAYELLTELVNRNMPITLELLSRDDADFYEDMLTMAWVGARNVEDTTLRHVVSDLEVPTFFKNSTNGSTVSATNAIVTAAESHVVRRIRPDGKLIRRSSLGNNDTGMIFRGGNISSPEQFAQQFLKLKDFEFPVIVDCSHGNTEAFGEGSKTPEAQMACVDALITLLQSGNVSLVGVMIESYLIAGSDTTGETPGKSLTDPCLDLEQTYETLAKLATIRSSGLGQKPGKIGGVALM